MPLEAFAESGIEFIGKCLIIKRGAARVLVVGDLHLGYEEDLNRAGIFVSRQMFKEIVADFERIFKETGKVDKIIILGDMKHDFGGISRQEWGDVLGLIDYLAGWCSEIVVIKGNHDNILAPILNKRKIDLRESYVWKDVCFVHGNRDAQEIWSEKIEFVVVGHIHPAIKLIEGAKVEKFKCFLAGKFGEKKLIVVPSFVEHNIGSDPRESEDMLAWKVNLNNFEVFVVSIEAGSLEALDFGKLGKIQN